MPEACHGTIRGRVRSAAPMPLRRVTTPTRRRPWPVLAIEILGYLGVAVWAVLITRTWVEDPAAGWWVTIVGVVLAAAHIVIAVGTARRTRLVVPAMWFVLVSDVAPLGSLATCMSSPCRPRRP